MSSAHKQLKLEDEFTFECGKQVPCFTKCCRDINIFLTPYDVIRLKKATGLASGEFLEKYTDLLFVPSRPLPMVQLRMNPDNDKKCFFVTEAGCVHYQSRPWACRMFPLDERAEGGFEIISNHGFCQGLDRGPTMKVREWLMGEGATQSKEMDGSYESLVSHERLPGIDMNNPKVTQMVLTAIYDLDRFRELILNSTFLDKFDLEPELIQACKTDDTVLLDLGFAWIRFGLFGQKTLKLKDHLVKDAQAKQGENK